MPTGRKVADAYFKTIDQRLQYLFCGTHYLLSVAMLTFMLFPALYLLFALSPIRADGVVRLVNHGSDRDRVQPAAGVPDPHYLRFGYTSHTGPEHGGVDNQFTVLAPDGTASARRRIEPLAVGDRFAASAHRDGDVHVVTASVVRGAAEVRVHRVTAPAGRRVRDGGHALAAAAPPDVRVGDGVCAACSGQGHRRSPPCP